MKTKFIISISILTLLFSCGKTEGPGGKNNITGYIYVENETLGIIHPATEKKVYIIYGDNSNYGDKDETNYDGYYHFDKLHPGNYTIFTYSKCEEINADCPSGKEAVFMDINLPDKKGTTEADTIFIKE